MGSSIDEITGVTYLEVESVQFSRKKTQGDVFEKNCVLNFEHTTGKRDEN